MDTKPQNSLIGTANQTSAAKVVPLLQSLNRVEESTAALALRLDPVVNHVPDVQKDLPPVSTVTSRLNQIADTLQYLLDNLEL
jgi:hypothetical protein